MENKQEIKFSLSTNAVKKMPFDRYLKDFTFIVDGQQYKTSRFFADFISPLIRQLHYQDETIDHFYINTSGKFNKCDFSKFLSLTSFDEEMIDIEYQKYYAFIFSILQNEEEYEKFSPKCTEEISLDNCLTRLFEKQKFIQNFNAKNGYFNYQFFDEEIEFISKHFSEISKDDLKKIDVKLFERILKNENLEIEDEDSLLKIINELYKENPETAFLYEYVHFENVSNEEMKAFFDIFDLNDINYSIWKSIIERTLNVKTEKQANSSKCKAKEDPNIKTFEHQEGNEFNGIIKYLTDTTGGNIHENGTISVTSNNVYNDSHLPENVLDFNNHSKIYSSRKRNGRDAWLCFDFKDKKVEITKYSIRSYDLGKDNQQLKSWAFEISNDGNQWTKIDEHQNCSTLNGNLFYGTFEIKNENNQFSRYFRIRQTGETWGDDDLEIESVEIYGRIKVK